MGKNYLISPGTLFEDFESLTGFTVGSGSAVVGASYYKTGAGAIRLAATTSGGNAQITKTISLNAVRSGVWGLWVYIEDITATSSISIYLSSSNFTSYFLGQFNAQLVQGWNFLTLDRLAWANTGGESWSNTLTQLRVRTDSITGSQSAIWVDSLYYGIYARPKIAIIMDDGRDSAYLQAYTMMKVANFRGTIGVNSDFVGTIGYCTLAQLKEMYAAGWDMANHTSDHSDMATLAASDIQQKIISCQSYLTAKGFTRGADHFIYPFGSYNNASVDAITPLNFTTVRTVKTRNQPTIYGIDNTQLLKAKELASSITLSTVQGYVDNAIARGESLLLFGHKLVTTPAASTEWAISDFQTLINYLLSKREQIDVVTMTEWYNGMLSSRRPV